MIISHQHKFIFLKTNKTAGTSIEIALSKFCGPRDVITPISLVDEKLRCDLGYRGPQNYKCLETGQPKFYNHMPAREVKEKIDPTIWTEYFKFCFERNPWSRAISLYHWIYRGGDKPTFSEYLRSNEILRLKNRGIGIYTIDGRVVVDKICFFENLQIDLEAVCAMLNINEKPKIPRTKSKTRTDRRNYREVIDRKDRIYIEKLFAEEIRLLGYVW